MQGFKCDLDKSRINAEKHEIDFESAVVTYRDEKIRIISVRTENKGGRTLICDYKIR